PPDVTEPFEERGGELVLPVDLEMRHEPRNQHDVDGTRTGDLVRNVDGAAARVPDVAVRGRAGRVGSAVVDHNRSDEAVAAPVRGTDDARGAAVVADSLARRFDAAGERRLADEAIAPNVVEELFLRHDPIALLDQVAEHVEHLRFDVLRFTVLP